MRFVSRPPVFQGGKLDVRGSLKPNGDGSVEIDGKRLGLTSFNPYVISASPYSLGSGSLSIDTKVALAKDRYDSRSQITVHGLALQGAEGDTLFHQQFGIPLSTALALLTDLHGDIALEVPVLVEQGTTKVDLGTVVRSALKAAVVGAVTSPLKLIGMITGGGDKVGSLEPPPLVMLPGRAEPSQQGQEQIAQLANLLATRPGVGLNLTGQVGASDVRWLHEQKLRASLEKGPGIVGAITGLPARNARKRILEALTERARDGAGDLSKEDAMQLDERLEKEPAPKAEEIAALAKARAERVAAALRDDHGIEERRLTVLDGGANAATAPSGVNVGLGLPG